MAIELVPGTRLRLTLAPVDAEGNLAQVQTGSVEWSASDPAVTVDVDPHNELVALVHRVDLGVAMVTAQADADLGEGVVPLTAQVEVAVVSGQAVSLGLTTAVEPEA